MKYTKSKKDFGYPEKSKIFRWKAIFFIIFLLFISVSYADYVNYGKDSNMDYFAGITTLGFTNASSTTYYESMAETLTIPPLVVDFDNDGDNEIFAFAYDKIYVYSNTMTLLASYDTALEADYKMASTGYIYAHDVDGDGYKEIWADDWLGSPGGAGCVGFIKVNISDASPITFGWNYSRGAVSGCSFGNGNFRGFSCSGERCGYAIESTSDANNALYLIMINSTNCSNTNSGYTIATNGAGTTAYCMPLAGISSADYDNDGKYEFLVPYLETSDSGNENLKIAIFQPDDVYLNLSSGNLEKTISEDVGHYANADSCIDDEKEYLWITQPLIYELDGDNAGYEIAIGVKTSIGFRIYLFSAAGSRIDEYPESAGGTMDGVEGDYIYNVYLSDYYSAGKGFCMDVYDTDDFLIRTVCGSREKPSGILGNQDYTIYESEGISYNSTFNRTALSHGIRHSNSSYSFFSASQYGIVGHVSEESETIFSNPKDESFFIPADVDIDGYDDAIYYRYPTLYLKTSTAYKYGCNEQPGDSTDDTFDGCLYAESLIRPSPNDAWNLSTGVIVQLVFHDYDNSGKLQAEIELYADEKDYLQNMSWKGNYSNDESVPFTSYGTGASFKANITGTHLLRIKVRDLDKPTQVQTLEYYFTVVSEGGVTLSDDSRLEIGATAPGAEELPETDTEDNSIVNTIRPFAQLSGIGVSALWILISIALMLFIFYSLKSIPVVGMLSGIFAFMAVNAFGVLIGVISFGIMIPFILMGVLVLALMFGKLLNSSST